MLKHQIESGKLKVENRNADYGQRTYIKAKAEIGKAAKSKSEIRKAESGNRLNNQDTKLKR
jgi:hypothetical protein